MSAKLASLRNAMRYRKTTQGDLGISETESSSHFASCFVNTLIIKAVEFTIKQDIGTWKSLQLTATIKT